MERCCAGQKRHPTIYFVEIAKIMSTIGERLRQERVRLDINQMEFGSCGGVLKQTQLKYEKGDRFPDAVYLEAISKAGADVQYILTGHRSQLGFTADELALILKIRKLRSSQKAAIALLVNEFAD